MDRRLDMLLNISVAGLKDVDKATQVIGRHGSKAKAVALGLTEIEGAAENAGKNFDRFREAAGRARVAIKKYRETQEALEAQQKSLGELIESRSKTMAAAESRGVEAAEKVQTSFQALKSVYEKASEASRRSFAPLGEGADSAQVNIRQLKDSLSEIEKSIRSKTQAAEQHRDALGRFTAEPVERGEPVDTSKLEQEQNALSQRANILQETINKVEQLTQAQERYDAVQQRVAEGEKAVGHNVEKIRAVEEEIKRLTQTKQELINTIDREANTTKQYTQIQKQLKNQEKELSEMTAQRAQAMVNAEARSSQATKNLEESFKRLKELYGKAEKAAGKSLKPIEGDAKNASVGMKQLQTALADIGKSYYELDQVAQKFRDSAGKPIKQPKGVDSSINIQDIEKEMKALDQRSQVIRDTMSRVEQLTQAQREYTQARKQVNEVDKKQRENNRLIEEAQQEVDRLIQRKEALLKKLDEEKQANNAYKQVHRDLQKQEKLLTQLNRERAKASKTSNKEAEEAAQKVKTVFEELKSLYARASEAAGTTFKPLKEGATNAEASLEQLRAALAEIEKAQKQISQSAQQALDFSDQTGDRPAPGAVNLEKLEQEKKVLQDRAQIMREAIEKAEQLTQAQIRNRDVQKEIAEVQKTLHADSAQVDAYEQSINKLTQEKSVLVRKLEKEGKVLNELSGQALVAVNKETGEASVRTKELDGVLRSLDETTKKVNTAMRDKAKAAENANKSKEGVNRSARQVTSALQEQNQEWNVMRQRISKNDEALWGLRRSLGALRNQILVVLFATRGLRNAMSSARDTIIEVDQGMIGLRRTAISMGQDFKELEGITRIFATRGLQNADEAAIALRNIMQTGLGVQEATNLLYTFTDAAAFNARSQRDLTDAVIRASEAFRDQRAQGLQAIGISQRMTDMVRAHANATGQQAAEISGLERHMAIYNAIMQESTKFTGNANDLLETYEGKLISLGGAAKSNSEAFGNLLRPIFTQFTEAMIDANKGAADFFNRLQELHGSDIDKWAARLTKFFKEVTAAIGAAGGGILRLIFQYGDWLIILAQVMIAKSILNKRMLKHADAMDEMQKSVKGYTFSLVESNAAEGAKIKTMEISNAVTGEKITGMEYLRILYQRNRIDVMRHNTALKAGIQSGELRVVALSKEQASLHTLSAANAGVTHAINTNTQAVLANLSAKTAWLKSIKALIAPMTALTATVRAAGGAMKVLAIAGKALLAAFLKLAAIFVAIKALTMLIGRLTGAKERADELRLANERLEKSFDSLNRKIARTQFRADAAREESAVLGFSTQAMERVEQQISYHHQKVQKYYDLHLTATNEAVQEHYAKRYEEEKARLEDLLDLQESYAQRRLARIQEIRQVEFDVEDKFNESITSLLSHYGVQQLHDSGKQQRDFEHFLREHHNEIEAITNRSAISRMMIEKQIGDIRRENERAYQGERKQIIEDMEQHIRQLQSTNANDHIQLQETTTQTILADYALRRKGVISENQQMVQEQGKVAQGLLSDITVQQEEIVKRIQNSASHLFDNMTKIITRAQGHPAREAWIPWLEEIQDRLEGVTTRLTDAQDPSDVQAMVDYWRELNEHVRKMAQDHRMTDVFAPLDHELTDHQRLTLENTQNEFMRALERRKMALGDFKGAWDGFNRTLVGTQEGFMQVLLDYNKQEDAMNSIMDEMDAELKKRLEIIDQQRKQEASIHNLNRAYEEAEKAVESFNTETERALQIKDFTEQRQLLQLQYNINRLQRDSSQAYTEINAAVNENNQRLKEHQVEKEGVLSGLRREREAIVSNIQALEQQKQHRSDHLQPKQLRDLNERIKLLQDEAKHINEVILANREQGRIQEYILAQENAMRLSRAHLAFITNKVSEAQQSSNEAIQRSQELRQVEAQTQEVELLERELTARSRLLPILGHIVSTRRQGVNAMQTQMQQQRDEIRILSDQKDAVQKQITLWKDYIDQNEELEGQEKIQAESRLIQLQEQHQSMGQLIEANEAYSQSLQRQLEIQRKQDFTRSIVDNFQPTMNMYQSFADGMREIDNQIILDRHRFQLEYMDQLKHGEINHAQHSHIMLAQQQYLAAQEKHLRQQRIAGLIRDVGREISLYAARLAAQSGNIIAAIGLLGASGGIMATANTIASKIERQSTMAFQQAEIEFSRAQRQMQGMDQGIDGDDSRSRKFGGTIRADNLVVNISPTMIVEGEQIFIGGGSAVEFSREVSEMMMEAIQNSIDNRRIDLSNISRGN